MAKQSPKRILINAKSAEKIKRYYEKTGQKVPTTIENGTANKSTISRLVKRVNNERKNGTEKYRIKLNEIKPFTNLKHLNASKLTPSLRKISSPSREHSKSCNSSNLSPTVLLYQLYVWVLDIIKILCTIYAIIAMSTNMTGLGTSTPTWFSSRISTVYLT